MYLRSLRLRGFKSFADKTMLEFEPGITVIVGPNGSGKSNIVDALTWALGSHSAKTLRGGSMADVIFAGSPDKPALGRASADITIDNTDGALPIEFSEVTVSRSMFATGENSYAINGTECRLLDVQELLSDSGLGREHHTIVGQGQIDAILNAKPEDRRAFIEEAAGILKHRKRKERALRKIAQMDGHVERLTDLLRELRRNLRPLERQAEAARKHAELAGQLRSVRTARALRELDGLLVRWAAEQSAQRASDDRLAGLEAQLDATRAEEARIEQALERLAPAARGAGETHFRLANLVERFRGLAERIEERRSGLVEAVDEPVVGRDPAALRARAAEERGALDGVDAERADARRALGQAEASRRDAEQARRAHEQATAAEARRRSEAREAYLRWEGEVAALRSSLAQAASEEGRLASQLSGLAARKSGLEADVAAVTAEIQRLDRDSEILAEQLTAAEAQVARRQAAAEEAAAHERELERQRAGLQARAGALQAASREASEGAAALLGAADVGEVSGVVGPLADHTAVVDGMAKAAAAALGPLGDAVVVTSRAAAERAIGFIRETGSGRVLLLPGTDDGPSGEPQVDQELATLGARPLADAFDAEPRIAAALHRALAGVYAVEDFDAACRLAARYRTRTFVSVGGQVAGPRGYSGGSAVTSTAVLSRAAAEQAETQLAVVEADLRVARRRLADADRELAGARRELDAANAAMLESDGLITAAAERLERLRRELGTCRDELAALEGQRDDLVEEITQQRQRLVGAERRGSEILAPEADNDGPDLEAERLEDVLTEAREREVQARLALSAVEQRGEELGRRIAALLDEAAAVEHELAERERRRAERRAAIERCGLLAQVTEAAVRRAEASLDLAAAQRDRVEEERAEEQRRLGVVRARTREVADELAGARESRHAEELRRAELQHVLDAVRERFTGDLGLDPDEALHEARAQGAHGPLGGGDERDAELAEEEERLVRKIALLGTVNPLALDEHRQLQERHAFLSGQLDDLRASRADLLEVVDAVDARIREVFAEAYTDVAAEFERMFPRLFPGGSGRLVLTDPDDLLNTGVEVEARPPGKRVKRLSLLSGGERSLTALAVLFAIFAARPSPFYVLDEVEAALDDVNLQRFLDIVRDFRASSQLIIVTHQKRTMEVADTLYGVTMQAGGVSKVISQRMDERKELAAAGGRAVD